MAAMLNFDYAPKHILKVQLFCVILCHFVPFIKYVFGTKVGFEKKIVIFYVTFSKNTARLNFLMTQSEI